MNITTKHENKNENLKSCFFKLTDIYHNESFH